MSEVLEELREHLKESGRRRGILEALLYHSMAEDKITFPTSERFIFNEVIRGTVECMGGEESTFVPPRYRVGEDGKKHWSTKSDNFEPNMWDYFVGELDRNSGKLQPKMEEDLRALLEPRWSSDQTGDGSYVTELYDCFTGGICQSLGTSTFSLPHSLVVHVEREIIPSLSEGVSRDVQGIGQAMRKYIEKDLEYIREHYRW